MSLSLRIISAGPGMTLQDSGRHGYLRYGVTAAGPMDPLAYATAVKALRAAPGMGLIEVSLGRIEVVAEGGVIPIAIAGGDFRVMLDGHALPSAVVLNLEPGMRLTIGPGASGAWCYLAAGNGIDVPPVLGSISTHTRSNLGGLDGRALSAGDLLPVKAKETAIPAPAEIVAPWLARPGDIVRVVLGPQDDFFSAEEIARFLDGPWTVSTRSDRMGYVLDGPKMTHLHGFNIVSDGIAHGGIQVPGEGKPIALMADRQPTGGYPKIATIISADLGRIAQLRPGERFRFAAVTIEEAVAARRAEAALLAAPITLRPLLRTEFPSEFLLPLNLIDGATDGD